MAPGALAVLTMTLRTEDIPASSSLVPLHLTRLPLLLLTQKLRMMLMLVKAGEKY